VVTLYVCWPMQLPLETSPAIIKSVLPRRVGVRCLFVSSHVSTERVHGVLLLVGHKGALACGLVEVQPALKGLLPESMFEDEAVLWFNTARSQLAGAMGEDLRVVWGKFMVRGALHCIALLDASVVGHV